jgi:hypothetical protein
LAGFSAAISANRYLRHEHITATEFGFDEALRGGSAVGCDLSAQSRHDHVDALARLGRGDAGTDDIR